MGKPGFVMVCPKAFHHRPQVWFKVNSMDEVLLRKDGSPDGEKLWDLGWIVHKHRSRSVFWQEAV